MPVRGTVERKRLAMTGRLWGRVRRDRGGESLLRDRDYLAWFAADTSWAFGTGVRSFAMLLVSFAVTGSAAQAGLISTVSTVCALVATVPGGVLVDRWDRRTSLITSGILRLVLCLLAALTWEMGAMDTAVLYVVGIGLGVVSGLFGTASDAALKSVVTGAQLPQAVSANQGRDGAVSLVASPISGALMAVSNALPFAVAAGAALIQVVATRVIRADLRPIDDEGGGAGGHPDDEGDGRSRWPRLDEYLAGFRFIVGQDVLCRLILGTVGINCGLTALFVGLQLVLKEDGVQTWRIGLLDSFMAVGMIVGAVIAQGLLKRVRTGTLIIGLFLAGCAALVPIALVQDIRVSLAALTVLGLVMPALNGAMMGYAQALIPGRLQGRVLSAAGLLGHRHCLH